MESHRDKTERVMRLLDTWPTIDRSRKISTAEFRDRRRRVWQASLGELSGKGPLGRPTREHGQLLGQNLVLGFEKGKLRPFLTALIRRFLTTTEAQPDHNESTPRPQ